MKKIRIVACVAASLVLITNSSFAQEKVAASPAKAVANTATKTAAVATTAVEAPAVIKQGGSVVDVAIGSKAHTTLVTALKAAGLVDALKGKGPFTVFAPTNDAFAKIPADALAGLLKPENKEALTKILTGHVVGGNLKSTDIVAAIKAGNGKAEFTTLSGEKITASAEGGKVKITDAAGNSANITTVDLGADNGVVHVLDAVLGAK
jgi:uncharacterized surface protein with fasciclin (FAS1) repeats